MWNGSYPPWSTNEGVAHIRCPLCGLVRRADLFDEETVDRHELERLERTSVGGRTGFVWTRGIDLTDEDVDVLQRCLLRALERLQALAGERGLEALHEEED
jgi:hypothetical protein